ncbi:helix-turn-helix transcriptional regulator [Pseudoalteromonas sp. MMG012]|uniref:helix-turn-helix domain-containing protein n=1 Tax=Pseudoalteromonas sp. MMG012 TaxID=2822686 RepID=UPI001B39D5B3|nr:helix-turn-helix transcriptional regulator [Pseudoalteromonas sp. MMG012]MBQ4852742.1 helix-turn-helix transcriptional regulator [Pseudoalteromonas sp. MMG012]
MEIIVNLDVMIAIRKVSSKELAKAIGITEANLSLLKRGKVKGVRFETLAAICHYLECQPGDILAFSASETKGVTKS